MVKENELDESFDEIEESDDTDWKSETIKLREKAIRQREKTKTLRDSLKEQEAKLAELAKPDEKKTKSDDKLLERLDKMALQVAGITEDDEVELFNKWKTETGREADNIVGNSIFKQELESLKTAKANQKATSDIKGERGESGVKNTPDYWIAKATKDANGQLLFSDEMPKELYSKVLEKLATNEPGSSEALKFYNSK